MKTVRAALGALLLVALWPAAASAQATPALRRAAEWQDLLVKDKEGQDVGRIQDAAVDPDTGRVLFVVLDAGAYIRKADRLSALPGPLLEAHGDHLVMADIGRGRLAAAHAVNRDRAYWPEPENQYWVELVWHYFRLEPFWPPIVDPTVTPPDGAAPAEAHGRGEAPAAPAAPPAEAWRFQWLSGLRGMELANGARVPLGSVENVIVDMPDLRVAYAVVKPRANLLAEDADPPAAERLVVVPWRSLRLWAGRLLVDFAPERLAEAPFIRRTAWPAMTRSVWIAGVGDVFGARPPVGH